MTVNVDLKKKMLWYDTTDGTVHMDVSCNVRTLKNGQRGKAVKEVRRSIPDNFPYDPMTFPVGNWKITGVEWRKDKGFDAWEYGDVKIRTDAWQMVETWLTDADGNYDKPTGNKVKDYGYLIHYSESSTTLGCIRASKQKDINKLAQYLEQVLKVEPVSLNVV